MTSLTKAGIQTFEPWRAGLEQAHSGAALLDRLISPRNARALVRALPSDDLHQMVHRIGLADCTELLAMASGEQVRDMLDAEVWTRDELSTERFDTWLAALMAAGPDVLGEKLLALDDEVLNWLVRRSVRVQVVEDPDDFTPEEDEYVLSPDGRLCIYFPAGAPRDLPLKLFLDWLARTDPVLCVDLLVHAEAALDSNLQEEAYRWRSGRMADRGYVDYYDALVVYTAPRKDQIRDASVPIEGPSPRRWLAPLLEPDRRLGDAFAAVDPRHAEQVEASLGYLANMALSADRVEPWDLEGQEVVLARLRAGLLLGLEVLAGADGDPSRDAAVIGSTSLTLVFRTGYGRMLDAIAPLRGVVSLLSVGPDAAAAVDLPALRPWAEVLTARHPTRLDGAPLGTRADLQEANAAARAIAVLARAAGSDRPSSVGIGAWLLTWMCRELVDLEGPGALPQDRLEAAHGALFSEPGPALARAWWTRIEGGDEGALELLLAAAREELGEVAAADLEPRHLSLLWVE